MRIYLQISPFFSRIYLQILLSWENDFFLTVTTWALFHLILSPSVDFGILYVSAASRASTHSICNTEILIFKLLSNIIIRWNILKRKYQENTWEYFCNTFAIWNISSGQLKLLTSLKLLWIIALTLYKSKGVIIYFLLQKTHRNITEILQILLLKKKNQWKLIGKKNSFKGQKQLLGGIKDVLKLFAKFTSKHLCWSLFS